MDNPRPIAETETRSLGFPICPGCATPHALNLTPGVTVAAICGVCGADLAIRVDVATAYTTRLRGPTPQPEAPQRAVAAE